MNEKSRLKKHLQNQAYRNVLLATLGIVLVIILLIIFGTNILVSFSLLVGKLSGTEEPTVTTQSDTYVAPPTLNPTETATSSAATVVTGLGEKKQRIDLYRNGKLISKTTVKADNTFRFTNVTLVEGENTLRAKAVDANNQQSDYSNEVAITFSNKPPELTIDAPLEGQVFKKSGGAVKVSGKTNAGAKVTVNDFRAIVDTEGNYSYLYPLKDGENELKIVATDPANNKVEKTIHIKAE